MYLLITDSLTTNPKLEKSPKKNKMGVPVEQPFSDNNKGKITIRVSPIHWVRSSVAPL